eukprot:NODE_36_length_2899_cov_602.414737_g31_i0.p1 GENE.NODE_36_length_2899_cov_602.414737_g31_i0~~NODE_36_length_2899_cov_602.414737_g31_i0.p1  ORF type:complete len:892 (+),score=282.54 NODE_36_length_2899_cov_602.414737_g31_i0:73-2748(+)
MFSHTYKPENALKRAEELIEQHQPIRALDALHDVISNRRYRVWQVCLEEIMLKHIDLCIQLRKGQKARDGLIQYRQISQQVNVGSLQKVVHHLLDATAKRVTQAEKTSNTQAAQLLECDDLEEEGEALETSPETLLMKAVSGEGTKDRTDREILMPWIKFLWESYRTALDVTKSNIKLEGIYHETAKKALSFCKRYSRKGEFRRLCELIRTHRATQGKYHTPEQRAALLASQDSFNRVVETRFMQLQVATDLDLWQEAYKSIEDIHSIITFFKKAPPPKQMIEYFDKLMCVFLVSKNHLFHAYACLKFFNQFLRQPPKKHKNEESLSVELLASKVLLAVLCVPFWERKNANRQQEELFMFNMDREKNTRITTLLGSTSVPTRTSLLRDVENHSVIEKVFPELKPLHSILEVAFNPLNLCHQIPDIVTFLNTKPELAPYVPMLQKVAAVRMVEQVGKVYDTMKITELERLCPYSNFKELEPLLVEIAKSDCLDIRLAINHQSHTITFTEQRMCAGNLSGGLSNLNRLLEPVVRQCVRALAPPKQTIAGLSHQQFPILAQQLEQERQAVLDRRLVIEERKEKQEMKALEAAKVAERESEEKKAEMQSAEMIRLSEDAAQREKDKQKQQEALEAQKECESLYTEIVQQKKGALKLKQKVKEDGSIMKDHGRLIDEAKKVILNVKEERDKRLKEESQRRDHFERACREEDRKLRIKYWEDKKEKERKNQEQNVEKDKKDHKDKWQAGLAEKKRLSPMLPYWEKFRAELDAQREQQERKEKQLEKEREEAMRKQQHQMVAEQQKSQQAKQEEEDEEEEEAEAEAEQPPPPAPAPKKADAPPAWRSSGQASSAAPASPPPSFGASDASSPAPKPLPKYVPPSQRTGAYVPPAQRKEQ